MITINWTLGNESGIETCQNDREATKFNEQLLNRKMQLAGLKVTQLASFQNKLWSYKEKRRKAYRREKVEQIEREYAPVLKQAEILKAVVLSVSIKRS